MSHVLENQCEREGGDKVEVRSPYSDWMARVNGEVRFDRGSRALHWAEFLLLACERNAVAREAGRDSAREALQTVAANP